MNPFWITFYSYKGGVGRSLALANIAALLVQRGRRVVLIDFDLEAPGLDSFEEFKAIAAKPGVVEYVTEYKNARRAPDIAQFIHPCTLPGPLRGKLWIMPAGKKDSLYNACRAKLNWADLYENHRGELFVENWKAAIANHCKPDYVLVDSRTGLTDVGGICTLHLPDLVVMMFGLNEQNIRGVAAVAKTIRESEFSKLPQIHYVASPVPNLPRDREGALTKRWAEASALLGTKIESSIRYQAVAALSERLFVLEDQLEDSPLVANYQRLLNRLIDYNRAGLDFLLTQTEEAINDVDTSLAERVQSVFRDHFPDRAEALLALAKLTKAKNPQAAKDLAKQSLQIDPTYDEAFEWLLGSLRNDKDFESALALCKSLSPCEDRLSPERRNNLHIETGETAMSAGDYATAAEAYAKCATYTKESHKKGEVDPISQLITFFNEAEARRRATRTIQEARWLRVVVLFDLAAESSGTTLILQANRWQAMHIAYALTGATARAREALIKARQAAELLGPTDLVFSVKAYAYVPFKQFL